MRKLRLIIPILLIAILGYFLFHYEEELKNKINIENQRIIETSHNSAINNVKSAVSSYYFIVSATKAYTRTLESPPTAIQLKDYITAYTENIDFRDSILLSFLDTNHQFVYTVGPNKIDPVGLTGFNVSWFRDDNEMKFLDSIMQLETISLTTPINLVEGWPAFPFSFHLKYKNDLIYGYIAAVLNINYITDKVYNETHDSRTFHRFFVNDSMDFTDVAIYNKTTIYNEKYDSLYYKNRNLKASDFIYSSYDIFGQNFSIGTSLLKTESNYGFTNFLFEAYLLLGFLVIILIWFLYRKN